MGIRNNKVLIIDQDEFLVRIYANKLEKAGFDPYFVTDTSLVPGILVDAKPGLVIYEPQMADRVGLDYIALLKQGPGAPAVMVLSVLSRPEDIAAATKLGADAYMSKTQTTFKEVVAKVRELLG
jgi:DNA-binding response OmpR family regulator